MTEGGFNAGCALNLVDAVLKSWVARETGALGPHGRAQRGIRKCCASWGTRGTVRGPAAVDSEGGRVRQGRKAPRCPQAHAELFVAGLRLNGHWHPFFHCTGAVSPCAALSSSSTAVGSKGGPKRTAADDDNAADVGPTSSARSCGVLRCADAARRCQGKPLRSGARRGARLLCNRLSVRLRGTRADMATIHTFLAVKAPSPSLSPIPRRSHIL